MAKGDSKDSSSSFDRDFGYLIPFLEKVTNAAESMSSPAGAELRDLLSGEVAKWNRIRALLSGAASQPAPTPRTRGPAPTPSPEQTMREVSPYASSMTVGSLRGK